jgi:hypothetical protein
MEEAAMNIERRIAKLEARAGATPSGPTHAEAIAAQRRVTHAVRAKLAARIADEPWTEDPDNTADRETLRRYCAARGIVLEPNAHERLKVMFGRIADNRAADLARRRRNAQRTVKRED